jgi:Na+-transporting NADH:ubiquinone oxidoreductase subunit C
MMVNDSIKQTLTVAVALCLVCSIVVSAAAVVLKPIQLVNKNLDKQARILALVDLLDKKQDIKTQFDRYVETKVVDLNSGAFVENINVATFDQRKLARDPGTSIELSDEKDKANINRRAQFTTVYLIKKNGELQYVVLPVHGYGLWSTMYGFIALQSDLNTVYGISVYEHAETPGLGGEIDNAAWQAHWRDKKLFADNGSQPALNVVKGNVESSAADAEYKVDGLAGATLTARGVGNMIQF